MIALGSLVTLVTEEDYFDGKIGCIVGDNNSNFNRVVISELDGYPYYFLDEHLEVI